jgi:hypothetical protein
VAAGSKVALQVHYNSSSAGPGPDRTSVDFKVDTTVEKEAMVLPFTNPAWVQTPAMTIPAGSTHTVHEYSFDITPFMERITNDAISNGPVLVHSVGLHMHNHGRSGNLSLVGGDGIRECMLDIPRWDFHWQGMYRFAQPRLMQPGDKISLQCAWDNPTSEDIAWGEGTGDEMCLGILYLSSP